MKPPAMLALICLLVFACITPASAGRVSPQEAKTKLYEAFEAIAEAERMGGNVSSLVAELNEALRILEVGEASGDYALIHEAVLKAESIISLAPHIGREGAAAAQTRILQNIAVLCLLAASALLTWRFSPRLFWSLWLRSKHGWRVRYAGG